MKKFLAIIALAVGFSSVSHAGLLVEPYLGYEKGSFDVPPVGDGDLSGVNLGARLAYTLPAFFWFGGDVQYGNLTTKVNGTSEDATRTNLYAVAGVNFPILFRAWLGYGLVNEIKAKDSGNKYKGSSTKLGASFTGLPFVCLNLEMIKDSLGDTPTGIDSFDNTSYMFSVSLPLEF